MAYSHGSSQLDYSILMRYIPHISLQLLWWTFLSHRYLNIITTDTFTKHLKRSMFLHLIIFLKSALTPVATCFSFFFTACARTPTACEERNAWVKNLCIAGNRTYDVARRQQFTLNAYINGILVDKGKGCLSRQTETTYRIAITHCSPTPSLHFSRRRLNRCM